MAKCKLPGDECRHDGGCDTCKYAEDEAQVETITGDPMIHGVVSDNPGKAVKVRLISTTTALPRFGEALNKPAEEIIAYCARVSSSNQESPDIERLLRYLIEHKHWSPFEMADMTVEIVTSRAIAPQILRHRSFSFQEFSQRYAEVRQFESVELRRQGESKQGSLEVIKCRELQDAVDNAVSVAQQEYDYLIDCGVSRETARMILPLCTQTKIYMKGSVRSWIHYLQVRCGEDTQKEHREIAEVIREIFRRQFPITSKALGWGRRAKGCNDASKNGGRCK